MPHAPPTWLDRATIRRMQGAQALAVAGGQDAQAIAEAVREVVLARHPALPMTMIDEAVGATGWWVGPEALADFRRDNAMRSAP